MTESVALLAATGRGGGRMVVPLDLLARRELPAVVVEPDPFAAMTEAVASVQALATDMARAAAFDPAEVRDTALRLLTTVLADVIGAAVDADRLGLSARIEAALAMVAEERGQAELRVSPEDAAWLEPAWAGPVALTGDPALPPSAFRLQIGAARVADDVARRLEMALAGFKAL